MKFGQLLTSAKWYVISSFTSKIAVFLTIPFYTKSLSVAEFGAIETAMSTAQLTAVMMSLYMDSALVRYFHFAKTNEDKKQIFSTAFTFVLFFGTLMLSILIGSSLYISNYMQIGQTLLILAYISMYLGQLNNLFICFYKQEVNSKILLKLDLLGVLTSLSSALFFLLILIYGPQSKFIGIIISMIILLILNLYIFYKRGLFSLSFDKKMGKEMILYAIPFIPNYVGGWIMDLSDRIIIAKVVNVSSVGIYSIANQLSRVLYIIQDSLTKVQYPMLMKSLTGDDETSFHLIKKFNHKILALIMTIYLSMALFISDILIIFQKQEYLAAKNVFIILGLTYVVTSQYRSSIAIINFKKMNLKISITSIAAALINLAINLVLIEKIGIIGAAISTVVSSLIYTVIVIKIAKSLKAFEIGFYKIAVMFTTLLSSLAIDFYCIDDINYSLDQYLYKIGILLTTSITLLYTSGLLEDIRKKLFN